MRTVKGKVAAVTGAASGIGRATAEALARRGCALALSDVNAEALEVTAQACRALGVQVRTTRVDVSRRDQVQAWADDTAREFGGVQIIVNNAGVALGATVEDTSYEDFEWLMGINFWGVVHGTRAFLPHLRQAGEGHVVNVSSLFGLIALPTQAAYNASKFAVRGFTDALRQELEVEGCGIGVTCVHPGGIKTRIARSARTVQRAGWLDGSSQAEFERLFSTSPRRAAECIVAAILGNHRRELIGADAYLLDLVQRVMPRLFQRAAVAVGRRRHRRMLSEAPPAAPASGPGGAA
jgi:NAD(P)-dependent dehydrogenase (short-subunit alcohol dehydrogenase family)